MTKEQVLEAVNEHNARIKDYIERVLPWELQQIGISVTKDNKIPLEAWF